MTHFFCGLAAAAALAGAATALAGAALTGAALTGAGRGALTTLATRSPAGFGLRTLCFLENFKFLKNFGSTFLFVLNEKIKNNKSFHFQTKKKKKE